MHAINPIPIPSHWDWISPDDRFSIQQHLLRNPKRKIDFPGHFQESAADLLLRNLKQSGLATANFLSFLKTKNCFPISAYLRINTEEDFSLLIVLTEDDFLHQKMTGIYDYLTAFENNLIRADYHLQISFVDSADNINEDIVYGDGFILKYKTAT